MEATRKRGSSFHEDFDGKTTNGIDDSDGPPKIEAIEEISGSGTSDSDPPTRARSRSVHANDPGGPPRPVVSIDPTAIKEVVDPKPEGKTERSNQLNTREVKALKMVN